MLTIEQSWGVLLLLVLAPALGALPLGEWAGQAVRGILPAARQASQRDLLWLVMLVEALQGLGVVGLARQFFLAGSVWELVGLAALGLGRYWAGRRAAATSAISGACLHDPAAALLTGFLALVSFTLVRDRQAGRLVLWVIYPVVVGLLQPAAGDRVLAAMGLGALLAWTEYQTPVEPGHDPAAKLVQASPVSTLGGRSRRLFALFRGDRSLKSLEDPLKAAIVGDKAANLSQLLRWGYPVLPGWVVLPGDDPGPLMAFLAQKTADGGECFDPPLIARTSVQGARPSLRPFGSLPPPGQRSPSPLAFSVSQIKTPDDLTSAITAVFESYDRPSVLQDRRNRSLPEDSGRAVLIQPQVAGAFSGIAFSRVPKGEGEFTGCAALVQARPGDALSAGSRRTPPEIYRLDLEALPPGGTAPIQPHAAFPTPLSLEAELRDRLAHRSAEGEPWISPESMEDGDVPRWLVVEVAQLARSLEQRCDGTPQAVEWTFDGDRLWILQTEPQG